MPILGQPARGASSFPASLDRALVSRFVMSEAGDVTQVQIWFTTDTAAGTSAKFIIHADNGTEPGLREYVSAAQAIPAGGGLLTWAVSGLNLPIGGHHLGYVVSAYSARHNQDEGVGQTRMMNGTYSYASPPSDWNRATDNDYNNELSAALTYTAASSGITGSGAVTSENTIVLGAGQFTNKGDGAVTGDATVASGQGAGAGAVTAGDAVAVGAGQFTNKGDGAVTAGDATAAGSGVVANQGSGSVAGDDTTAAGSGSIANAGTGAVTGEDAAAAGAGAGAGSVTTDDATVVAAQGAAITGDGAVTAGDTVAAGSGVFTNKGDGSVVAGDAIAQGSGTSDDSIHGSGAVTTDAAIAAGAGKIENVASGAVTTANATVISAGGTPIDTESATKIAIPVQKLRFIVPERKKRFVMPKSVN